MCVADKHRSNGVAAVEELNALFVCHGCKICGFVMRQMDAYVAENKCGCIYSHLCAFLQNCNVMVSFDPPIPLSPSNR